jgi:hypothetical protein
MLLTGSVCLHLSACGGCPPKPDPNGPKGYALAIGLNKVDPAHYDGWDGALDGCEPDAEVMFAIAQQQGLEAEKLLTADATHDKLLARLGKYAEELKSGDLLVVSYSGHGGTLPDENGDEQELTPGDLLDETWVLYDGQLLDDELAGAWSKFKSGVRILLFSDSCHSGTVLKCVMSDFGSPPLERVRELNERWKLQRRPRLVNPRAILDASAMREALRVRPGLRERLGPIERVAPGAEPPAAEPEEIAIFENRSMPFSTMIATYGRHREFYRDRGTAAPKESELDIKATVILISGCQDDQYSTDLGFNGLFTWRLNEVWNSGNFAGDHEAFHQAIREKVLASNSSQDPNYMTAGADNPEFEGEKPYTVDE